MNEISRARIAEAQAAARRLYDEAVAPPPRRPVMNEVLVKCWKPDCMRKISHSVRYCCSPCALADEQKYEIHEDGPLGHSVYCNARRTERGECTLEEAYQLRQAGAS